MALKLDKMKKAFQDSKRGGEFWSPDEGETRVYLMPPCRPDDTHEPTDGLNYVPVGVHFSVGKDNSMVLCLDHEKNQILNHPFVKEFLAPKGKKLDPNTICPICKALAEGRFNEEESKEQRFNMRFLWGVVPVDYTRKIGGAPVQLPLTPSPYMTGSMVFDGFMKAIVEVGDITDFESAVLVKITKAGNGIGTKYQVSADIESVRKPLKLDKAMKRLILDSIKPEGACDLFKLAANLVKSQKEIEAMITGIKVAEEEAPAEEETGPRRKPCYGLDYTEDVECKECPDVKGCAAACGVEAPATSKGKARTAPKPEPEPEAEDEQPALKGPSSGDDDEDLDKLEEQLTKMGSKKRG